MFVWLEDIELYNSAISLTALESKSGSVNTISQVKLGKRTIETATLDDPNLHRRLAPQFPKITANVFTSLCGIISFFTCRLYAVNTALTILFLYDRGDVLRPEA